MARKHEWHKSPITLSELQGLRVPAENFVNFEGMLLTPKQHRLVEIIATNLATSPEVISLNVLALQAGYGKTPGDKMAYAGTLSFYRKLEGLGAPLPQIGTGSKGEKVDKALDEALAQKQTIHQMAERLHVGRSTIHRAKRRKGVARHLRTHIEVEAFTSNVLAIWNNDKLHSQAEIVERLAKNERERGSTPNIRQLTRQVEHALETLRKQKKIPSTVRRGRKHTKQLEVDIHTLLVRQTPLEEVTTILGIDSNYSSLRREHDLEMIQEIQQSIQATVKQLLSNGGMVTTDGAVVIQGSEIFQKIMASDINAIAYEIAKWQASTRHKYLSTVTMTTFMLPDGRISKKDNREMVYLSPDCPINTTKRDNGDFVDYNTTALVVGLTRAIQNLIEKKGLPWTPAIEKTFMEYLLTYFTK